MNKITKLTSLIKISFDIVIDIIFIIYSIIYNLIFFRRAFDYQNIIVTASDKYYYDDLIDFLVFFEGKKYFTDVFVYDLGLTEDQIKNIQRMFPFINLYKFKFENYPAFIGHRDSDTKLGGYAWKPLIIQDVYLKSNKTVFWFDTGTRSNRFFINSLITIKHRGYFSTYSPGTIQDWTIKSVVKKLNVSEKDLRKRNLNGAIVGFKQGDTKAKKLLDDWVNLSLKKELIVPNDNSRKNHRHDQSLLTILSYRISPNFFARNKFMYGIKIHQHSKRVIYIHDKLLNNKMKKFRENWYKQNQSISTNTFKKSKIVIFLNIDQFRTIKNYKFKNKLIIVVLQSFSEVLVLENYLARKKLNVNVLLDSDDEINNNLNFPIFRLKLTEENLKNFLFNGEKSYS